MHLSRRSFLGAATAAAAAGSAAAVYAASSRSSATSELALASASSRAGDVVGKITVGYQGWFACVGDHSPIDLWWHWSQNESQPPSPSNNNLKAWPDMREYGKWYHTGYADLHNGDAADLFSSYDQSTVNAHFRWMQQHGCDTAALQRFNPDGGEGPIRNAMAAKVRTAAEAYGRKFYIMYDVTDWFGMQSQIKTDWTEKMSAYAKSSAYARQDGKPVVCIWGFGFNDDNHPFTPAACQDVVNWFKQQGVYLIGGVPREWRLGTGGSRPGFLDVYHSFDALSPWMVGAIGTAADSDWMYTNFTVPDEADCKAHGLDYQPCVLPGDVSGSQRAHGDFMWRQFYNMRRARVQGIYISMFDEFGEGNQICKTADTQASVPAGSGLRTLDQDGTVCSSDYYLRLTNDGGRMLKGEIALTATRPTKPFIAGGAMGLTLSLRAKNKKVVAADSKGTPALVASSGAIGSWGQFALLDAGSGNVALRVRASSKIVTVQGTAAAPLIANGTKVGQPETFELIHNANGTVSLLAHANKRYVSAKSTGAATLAANSAAIGPWEQFTLIADN